MSVCGVTLKSRQEDDIRFQGARAWCGEDEMIDGVSGGVYETDSHTGRCRCRCRRRPMR